MKNYQVNSQVKMANWFMSNFVRLGLAPARFFILGVKGRKSGNMYTTPVSLVIENGRRWLVSPYGERNWVKNARAAGLVKISRGGEDAFWKLEEIDPVTRAPILKKYLSENSIVQPYFKAQPSDSLEEFEKEASDHPVFLLTALDTDNHGN